MAKCLFNLFVIIICLIVVVLCVVGCGAEMTPENLYGLQDPNEVEGWINFGMALGQGAQTIGAATGNPYMIAYGGLLILIGGTAAQVLFNRKKKEGEDNGAA